MKRITRTFLTVATTAAVAVVSASAALAGPTQGLRAQPEGDDVFIPGVTDFPARPPVFIPGVTDFPVRPVIQTETVSAPRAEGFDWSDAGIVAGSVAVLALLAAAAVAALRRRSKALLGTAALGVAMIVASVGGGLNLNHNETILRD
jgi:hypothetical protein